jgi:hypothetical protein
MSEQVVRGSFELHDNDPEVRVHSSADFLLYIWARNLEKFAAGVEVITPASQFRGVGGTGPQDGILMDVPAQTGTNLGCIGGKGGERFSLSSPKATISIFLTVVTAQGANVTMVRRS